MKGNGHVGVQLILVERGQVPMKNISTHNKIFTLIGLTALTGEPVMCALVIEGKISNRFMEAGIDIQVSSTGLFSDNDFVLKTVEMGSIPLDVPSVPSKGRRCQHSSIGLNQQASQLRYWLRCCKLLMYLICFRE